VVVSNKSGPFEGIEKLCRIRVQLPGDTTVAVSSLDEAHCLRRELITQRQVNRYRQYFRSR